MTTEFDEMIDIRQVIYTMGINGKMRIAQQAHTLIDSESIKTFGDLRTFAESVGVSVSDDMPPSILLEEIVSVEQYAKFS